MPDRNLPDPDVSTAPSYRRITGAELLFILLWLVPANICMFTGAFVILRWLLALIGIPGHG